MQTLLVRVQPGTPPRQVTCCINGHGAIAIPVADSNHTKQLDGQLSLPAADARPYGSIRTSMRRSRSLALDHGSAYLDVHFGLKALEFPVPA